MTSWPSPLPPLFTLLLSAFCWNSTIFLSFQIHPKSARADGERFWFQTRFGKWGNSVRDTTTAFRFAASFQSSRFRDMWRQMEARNRAMICVSSNACHSFLRESLRFLTHVIRIGRGKVTGFKRNLTIFWHDMPPFINSGLWKRVHISAPCRQIYVSLAKITGFRVRE